MSIVIKGLPIFGERVTYDNINVNELVSSVVKNERIYCIVVDKTNTMLKVKDLEYNIDSSGIHFNPTDKINNIHKNYLSFTRNIIKITNYEFV